MKNILIIIIALFYVLPASAGTISGVSGDIANSGTITISGSGFGTKSPVAPILWETFEDGVAGAALSTTGKWVKYANAYDGGTFSTIAAYNGSLSAYNNVRGSSFCAGCSDSFTLREFNMSTYTFDPTDTVYYSYNWRYTSEGDLANSGVVKAGRINTGTNQYNGEGSTSLTAATIHKSTEPTSNTSFAAWMEYVDGTSPDYSTHLPYSSYVTPIPVYGAWERHEIFKKLSTPGVADGQVDWSINNVVVKQLTDHITRPADHTGQHTSVALGLMMANPISDQDAKFFVDDVYIDNTQARIELCTGSTWATRTHCEPQIPKTTWNATTAVATVNTGTLATGSTAYLYVVDSAGAVNANGYQVTVNSGATDVTKPTTSTNKPSARYTATQSVTLTCSDDVACTSTKYCYGMGCTPTTTYETPFPILKNLASQSYCVSSTDGTNTETVKCFDLKKQIRR